MPSLNSVKRGTLRWESRAKTNGNIRNCVETRGESRNLDNNSSTNTGHNLYMMKSYANEEQLLTFAKNIKNYMNCEEIVQPIENKESIELEDKEPLG